VRHKTNHYVTGRDGGREIDLRVFATEGMQLHGRLDRVEGTTLHFRHDLKQNLDAADAVAESIKATIDAFIDKQGIDAPPAAPFCPAWQPLDTCAPLDLEAAQVRSVIWSTGYHMDFRWIEVPVFDGQGYPGHDRGVTPVSGLYFLGLPWLYTWGSGRFSGIARDALYLADRITLARRKVQSPLLEVINEWAIGS
jgi:putative flavoprotein involved in K+ transport